jgi:hypothetical protein
MPAFEKVSHHLPLGFGYQAGCSNPLVLPLATVPVPASDFPKQLVVRKKAKPLEGEGVACLKAFRSKVKPGPALSWQDLRDEGRRY